MARRPALALCELLCVLSAASLQFASADDFGPLVQATRGEVWPRPHQQVYYGGFMSIRPSAFTFNVTKKTCSLLQEALRRYTNIIHSHYSSPSSVPEELGESELSWRNDPNYDGILGSLDVQLVSTCEEFPYLNMDEHYELRINSPDLEKAAMLTSQTVWGILRGLETFSQLLYLDQDVNILRVNSTAIMDFPRYAHRGLMLDTSRHFLKTSTIRTMLDGMEMNKMNVFHWHIVDSQSFPYQSKVFPDLSKKGAYNAVKLVYSQDDVENITEHARLRGIRVIPEFDTPGHTSSWGRGQPGLLTPCDGTYGPINPALESTYTFLRKLFQEVGGLFPDSFIHLGGDEVTFDCWESNPGVVEFMSRNNISSSTELEVYYMGRVLDVAGELNLSAVVWQDVFDNGVLLPRDALVHVWNGIPSEELAQVTAAGHRALLSACWYLDSQEPGSSWRQYYDCDPADFPGSEEQKKLVIGGEACMWGELVDDSNVVSRVWPHASAAAEKLWSPAGADTEDGAATRLEEHYCRMRRRGVSAQPPNGPGYCL